MLIRSMGSWYERWIVLVAGLGLTMISAVILAYLQRKIRRKKYISKDDMTLTGPMIIAGLFGPLTSIIGLFIIFEGETFPIWGSLLIILLIVYLATFIICTDAVSDYRKENWRFEPD